jgi:AmmeMemoRadiSam system protein B
MAQWRPYVEDPSPPGGGRAVSVIAPHAGWVFSGKLAAKAIWRGASSLGPEGPELVAVLGGHLAPGDQTICFGEKAWATPLGDLEIASELNQRLSGPLAPVEWRGPTDDNTIEVQLPLVRLFCPRARLWPLRVASGPAALALGDLLAELSRQARLLIVASTDLTHYGRVYGFAPAGSGAAGESFRRDNDRLFIEAALALDPELMMSVGEGRRAACSAGAAAAAVQAAKALGAEAVLLDHYSSCDISPGAQSVGYAGLCLSRPAA